MKFGSFITTVKEQVAVYQALDDKGLADEALNLSFEARNRKNSIHA